MKSFLWILVAIGSLGGFAYSYLDLQNNVTKLHIELPKLRGALKEVEEENTQLVYEICAFENPQNLIKLAKEDAYAHLKFPAHSEVVYLSLPMPLEEKVKGAAFEKTPYLGLQFATGSRP